MENKTHKLKQIEVNDKTWYCFSAYHSYLFRIAILAHITLKQKQNYA